MVLDENVAHRSSKPHHPPDRYGDHVRTLKGEKCRVDELNHNDVILREQGHGT